MQEMYSNKEMSTETLGRIEQSSDLSGLSECAKGQGKEDKVPDPRATWQNLRQSHSFVCKTPPSSSLQGKHKPNRNSFVRPQPALYILTRLQSSTPLRSQFPSLIQIEIRYNWHFPERLRCRDFSSLVQSIKLSETETETEKQASNRRQTKGTQEVHTYLMRLLLLQLANHGRKKA